MDHVGFMKILHVNRNYLDSVLHQIMVEHLDKYCVKSSVFVPICKRDIITFKPNENVCTSCCFNYVDRYLFDLKQLKIIHAVEKNFDVSAFECIHAYTLFTDGNVAMHLAKKYNKPFVVAVRDTDVNDFFGKLFYLRKRGIKIMLAAKKIFFLSESYRNFVFEKFVPRKFYDELYSKTRIIPNGIDDFWHENYYRKEICDLAQPIKLICVGKIMKRKNIPTILAAMKILRDRGVQSQLTVIGNVVDQSEFDKIKEKEFVKYLPAMPKEQLIKQYRKHDVFIMPSFTETFGLVYAEALSQSLPVIYSFGQGFDGQFNEGYVGFHCDSYDSNDVANTIMKTIHYYKEMVRNCYDALSKFKWDDICRQYKSIYEGVGQG